MGARAMTHLTRDGREHPGLIPPFQSIVESIPAITYARRSGAADGFLYLSPQIASLLGWEPV